MSRISIPVDQFIAAPYALWEEQWLLLTCGDFPSGKVQRDDRLMGSDGQHVGAAVCPGGGAPAALHL